MAPAQAIFSHDFDTPFYKGTARVHTGLFINNEWVQPVQGGTIDIVNPANAKILTQVSIGTSEDVDIAVAAAQAAFKSAWGLNVPGAQRGDLLNKLAELVEQNLDELTALECANTGIPLAFLRTVLIPRIVGDLRYFAGWAGKVAGKTIETNPAKFAYTLRQPIGVVAQIIPWNAPLAFMTLKIAPALACGCSIVLKPSEITPLTALRMCDLIKSAGFPPGVVNIVVGYGTTVGRALSSHLDVRKVSFIGSVAVGKEVARSAADSNLKKVSLELGGKSPNVIFDDADLDQALKWTELGIFGNSGQTCSAGSRIFVQEGIYDKFVEAFVAAAKARKLGNPHLPETAQGPQISKIQFDRVLGYIDIGKQEGATILTGGRQHGKEGFFIEPTVFTNTRPDMRIVREEIFGPVGVVVKFRTEEEAIKLANDTSFGLASAIFTLNVNRAIRVSNAIEAGTVFVNCYNWVEPSLPWTGYKQSGWGHDSGEDALSSYTEVKSVHMNIGLQM
ncbi:uncharacterized protein FIBRA_08772 [Fibroporia radiculosa]|uniref:Aldehyde dehydrogenase domain-containing protein n=1 Tax=Fibroporia radiculosa TaxID=599839 RepID=J4I3B0_9APHY|nr:uncharacterized protein FIBRA_08772 [Fibroporia radiculosa]CCM06502.1 predicted protein [Fibroporia radiculosa]